MRKRIKQRSMWGNRMKKLLLIPTVLTTMVLAVAFFVPATASGVARSGAQLILTPVAPALASSIAGTASSAGQVPTSVSTRSSQSAVSLASEASATGGLGHQSVTPGTQNCGRNGNGFHGGKHNFACRNRPFPEPANPDHP